MSDENRPTGGFVYSRPDKLEQSDTVHYEIDMLRFNAKRLQDTTEYINGQFTPLSKPFRTKAAAEKARLKLPERERREVAVGVIRTKR
jgi:hypothetical protein